MSRTVNVPQALDFHGIDTLTGEILRQNKSYILRILPEALDAFYQHVQLFPDAARFFRSKAHMAHARDMQIRHWGLITEGRFDEAYVASVTRIGEVHNAIGLAPRFYIGGYNFLLVNLSARIAHDMASGLFNRGGLARATALQGAITKALMLDMDFAISVYLDSGRRERRQTLDGLAQALDGSVGAIVASLSQSAGGMHSAAEALHATAGETLARAGAVASASADASESVRSVASATEEMSASVQDVDRQVAESAAIAGRAVEVAGETVSTVGRLSAAADKIGAIVDLISTIAGQTNLLALNATIEAARAGDAGKGFAVVASEVKALAEQTAKATSEIEAQIGDMQAATGETASAIGAIADIVRQMNALSAAIATGIQQQKRAAGDISGHVQRASRGTQDVTLNMSGFNQAAADAGQSASQVLSTATELSGKAQHLRREVDRFLADIASA
ncbi:globin-coupled sensor protein [Azorhizobium doebereinerae]|uniref:globin-coupled sensor protein n=1 Tax=Azorhizobium doebereinerae TaxID=281091 RepID=UPI0003FA2D81|nr:globin-coupled sensor protein [Azorhizobium doebereinerae]